MHSIRLRGPWEFELRADESVARSGTVKLPSDLIALLSGDESHDDCLIVVRNFNRPTGITPADTIFLSVAGLETPFSTDLNGTILTTTESAGEDSSRRFNITSVLQQRNQLTITITTTEATTLPLEVELQIDSPDNE